MLEAPAAERSVDDDDDDGRAFEHIIDDVPGVPPYLAGTGAPISTVLHAVDARRDWQWIMDTYRISREEVEACIHYRGRHHLLDRHHDVDLGRDLGC